MSVYTIFYGLVAAATIILFLHIKCVAATECYIEITYKVLICFIKR